MSKTFAQLAKKYPPLFAELAHTYLENGAPDKALKIIEKYLERYPNEISGLLVKGAIQEYKGDFDTAETTYRTVIALEPKNIRASARLAVIEEYKPHPSDYWRKHLKQIDPLSPLTKKKRQDTSTTTEIVSPEATTASDELEKSADLSQTAKTEIETIESFEKEIKKEDTGLVSELESKGTPSSQPTEEISQMPPEMSSPQILEKEISPEPSKEEPQPEPLLKVPPLPQEPATEFQEPESGQAYSPSIQEIEALQKAYREIDLNQGKKNKTLAEIPPPEIVTPTMAEIYTQQGECEKALSVYKALPAEERAKYQAVMEKLEKRVQEIKNSPK
jgi:tetratricopeptide (TPR) repeat protein